MRGSVMGWIFLILIIVVLFGLMVPAIFITAGNETAINMSESEYEAQFGVVTTISTLLNTGGYLVAILMGVLGLMIVFIAVMHRPTRPRF